MSKPITAEKRAAINERLAAGEPPQAIADAEGVGRTTVRRCAARLTAMGGVPAIRAGQVADIPAARAFIEGDDAALDGVFALMDVKAQAETMRILINARSNYAKDRSCDVAELYQILKVFAKEHHVSFPTEDEKLREAWRRMESHLRASYPHIVDRMARVGLPL